MKCKMCKRESGIWCPFHPQTYEKPEKGRAIDPDHAAEQAFLASGGIGTFKPGRSGTRGRLELVAEGRSSFIATPVYNPGIARGGEASQQRKGLFKKRNKVRDRAVSRRRT